MIYAVVPHNQSEKRFFASFSGVEQFVVMHARYLDSRSLPWDWCDIVAYDGIDELIPVFVYRLVDGYTLVRSPVSQ